MACSGVTAICMAAVTALGTVQPISAILAGKFTLRASPSGRTGAGPIQRVAGTAIEALTR